MTIIIDDKYLIDYSQIRAIHIQNKSLIFKYITWNTEKGFIFENINLQKIAFNKIVESLKNKELVVYIYTK